MRVICPACGCHLETVPGVPLGVVACPECGKRIDLRRLAAAEAVAAGPEPVVASETRAGPTRVVRRRRRRSWLVPATVAMATAAAAVVATVVVLRAVPVQPPTPAAAAPVAAGPAGEAWDRAHRGELLSLKASADADAIGGRLQPAYDGYQKVLTLAAAHDVTDPMALQVVSAARAGQDRVFAALMAASGREQTLPANAVVPVPQPSAVAPTTRSAASVGVVAPFAGVAQGPASPPVPTTTTAVADAAMPAADRMGPVAHPPPPPALHAYTLPDGVSDAEIGRAIDNGIGYLRKQFRNAEIVTGLNDAGGRAGRASRRRGEAAAAARPDGRPPARRRQPAGRPGGRPRRPSQPAGQPCLWARRRCPAAPQRRVDVRGPVVGRVQHGRDRRAGRLRPAPRRAGDEPAGAAVRRPVRRADPRPAQGVRLALHVSPQPAGRGPVGAGPPGRPAGAGGGRPLAHGGRQGGRVHLHRLLGRARRQRLGRVGQLQLAVRPARRLVGGRRRHRRAGGLLAVGHPPLVRPRPTPAAPGGTRARARR